MNARFMLRCLSTALFLTCTSFVLAADGLPTAQPKRLTIIREMVKPGMGSAHARNEAGWPAAFEKAKNTDYYIALTAMTGANEAWYLVPSDSFASEAASMKAVGKDPVLSAELERLSQADGEFLTGTSQIQCEARPDLGLGKFPAVGKVRFYQIMMFSVQSGKEGQMDKILKTYAAARARVSPNAGYRAYTVAAGMPDSTYIILQTVEDYAEFDRIKAEHEKVFATATPEETAIYGKWGDTVTKSVTNYFRIDPQMSFVPKEVRASDPEFWSSK